MRRWLPILLWLPALVAGAIEAPPVAKDPVLEQRMMTLAEELRCLVCQNETLADSPAALAGDLRQEIRELMRAGRSDDEIVRYLTGRYGDFVLYRPPLKPVTWLLWFGPFALLLGAAGGFCLYVAHRNRRLEAERHRQEAAAPTEPGAPAPHDDNRTGT